MGDRTFSAEDVIRIYEDFLTVSEQETVDFFFAPEEVEGRVFNVPAIQAARDELGIVATTLPSILTIIIRFAAGFLPRFSLVSVAVQNARNILDGLIATGGGVDA